MTFMLDHAAAIPGQVPDVPIDPPPPIREPEPDRRPDEKPDPSPDENPNPPKTMRPLQAGADPAFAPACKPGQRKAL